MCSSHDYCRVDIPEEGKSTLKCCSGEKTLKTLFVLYADFECLLIKEESRQNNPEKSYAENKGSHEPSGYSLSLICSFDSTKNKHYVDRGKDCVEYFYRKLKELETEIINYEKKDMIPLTNEEIMFNENKSNVTYAKKDLLEIKRINLNT